MRGLIIFFSVLLATITLGTVVQSKMLLFIPAIITATPNTEEQPHQIYPLTLDEGSMEACEEGQITHGREFRTLSNSYAETITIVEMTIIDPSTWQFENVNLLPVTLTPGDTITYSISHIMGYLCENPPSSEIRVKFLFSDGNFQNV